MCLLEPKVALVIGEEGDEFLLCYRPFGTERWLSQVEREREKRIAGFGWIHLTIARSYHRRRRSCVATRKEAEIVTGIAGEQRHRPEVFMRRSSKLKRQKEEEKERGQEITGSRCHRPPQSITAVLCRATTATEEAAAHALQGMQCP